MKISIFKSYKIYIILSMIALITILGFVGYNNATYAVLLGDETIGFVKYEEVNEINELVSLTRINIENKLNRKVEVERPVTFKLKLGLNKQVTSVDEVKLKLEEDLKFNVDTFSIKVNDKEVVYLLEEEQADSILKRVKELYSAKYEDEEIEDVVFLEDVVVEKTITNAENIITENSAYYYLISNKENIKRYLVNNDNNFTYYEINQTADMRAEDIKVDLDQTNENDLNNEDVVASFNVEELPDIAIASRGISTDTANVSLIEKSIVPKSVLNYLAEDKPLLSVQVVKKITEEFSIPYEIEYKNTNTLYKGSTKVDVKGEEGKQKITYKVTFINNEEMEREKLSEEVVKEPINKVVLKGTKVKSTAYGIFIKPTTGIVTSPYGPRGGGFHSGIDIASSYGTSVKAADGGKVIFAGWHPSYGNLIKIDHGNGYQTWYAHNSKLYVSSGQSVARGQKIAAMGSTGRSTGNHLHFEIRKNGSTKNPASYIRF